jgi:hypothetical protein
MGIFSQITHETDSPDAPQTHAPAESIDLSVVDELVRRLGGTPEQLIPLLQAMQRHYRYLPEAALRRLCEVSDITPAAVAGVSCISRSGGISSVYATAPPAM